MKLPKKEKIFINSSSQIWPKLVRVLDKDKTMPQTIRRRSQLRDRQVQFETAILNLDQVKAERCRRSYFYFIKEFWAEVSPDAPQWNWHIEYLSEQLMELAFQVSRNEPKKHDLIINIPPGTTKSTCCSIMFPVWCWTKWFWMRFIVSSYSGALSLEHAEISRDLIQSEKFRSYFPELEIKRDKSMKSNFRIVKKKFDDRGKLIGIENGGNRYSTSVGGTLTGFHAHVLIVDDPLDPNRAASEIETRSVNRWLDQTLSTRKVDKEVTPTIMIMQRLHQDDPTGHVLNKKKENVFHICLPGEIRNYKHKVNPPELVYKYRGGMLDPKRMNWAVLAELEADLGQYGYAGQVGQEPTPAGGGMFKVDHFQLVERASQGVATVRFWDKAGSSPGKGAFTVGVKMTRLLNKQFVVLDVKRGQWRSDEREAIIKKTAIADGRNVRVYIEQEPGSGGKESADATIKNLAGFLVKADRPTGNKVYRADPYSVQVNNGNVLLVRADWNSAFLEEHRFFPFSKYKDQIDAAAGAFNKLSQKSVAGPVLK